MLLSPLLEPLASPQKPKTEDGHARVGQRQPFGRMRWHDSAVDVIACRNVATVLTQTDPFPAGMDFSCPLWLGTPRLRNVLSAANCQD